MAERAPISSYDIDQLEALDLSDLSVDELNTLQSRASTAAWSIEADDRAATKGLMPMARRWNQLQRAAEHELAERQR